MTTTRHADPTLATLVLATLSACMTLPPDLEWSLQHPSQDSRFIVTLQPPATSPALDRIHSWQVKLSSPSGLPVVTRARISVDGGMPQHGRGLPTRPQVTRELADGTYLLEGMKFGMTGWCEVKLAIETPEGTDKVTFGRPAIDPAAVR